LADLSLKYTDAKLNFGSRTLSTNRQIAILAVIIILIVAATAAVLTLSLRVDPDTVLIPPTHATASPTPKGTSAISPSAEPSAVSPAVTTAPPTVAPTPSPTVKPTPSPSPTPTPTATPVPFDFTTGLGNPIYEFDYSQSVPESDAVEDEYFADTAFIGNSRTEGFKMYSGLKNSNVYAARSITVMNIFNQFVIKSGAKFADGSDKMISIPNAVRSKQYKKIYIMLGINELAMNAATFKNTYAVLIDFLREWEPDAEIYVQTIFPVEADAYLKHGKSITNANINKLNEQIRLLAEEKELFIIDTFELFADENGELPEGYSFDGVHLNPKYCETWLAYLKTHTILPVTDETAVKPPVDGMMPPETVSPAAPIATANAVTDDNDYNEEATEAAAAAADTENAESAEND